MVRWDVSSCVPCSAEELDRYCQPGYLRFAWLVGGLPNGPAQAPGADLTPIVRQLADEGIEDLRQAGRVTITTTGNNTFRAVSAPDLGASTSTWLIDGRIRSEECGAYLDVQVSATRALQMEPYTERAIDFQTKTIVPYWQPVVLAAVPIGGLTSVIVVQVTPRRP